MQQRWQPEHYVHQCIIPLFAICTIGSAVEFCWAAGEAVLVPYLSKHGVRRWVVSTIYLANPTVGLWVQPRLGAWSDRINKRVPFVIALSLLGLAGIATLLSAIPLTKILGIAYTHNEDIIDVGSIESRIGPVAIVMAFVGFGTADICFDCLLIPGRALLDDIAVPAGRSNQANALFTGFQLGGRLLALLVGSSYWTTSGLWGLYRDEADAHFNACFTLSALYLVISMILVVVSVDDEGSTAYTAIVDESEGQKNDTAESELLEIIEEKTALHSDENELEQPPLMRQNSSYYQSNNSQIVEGSTASSSTDNTNACILLYIVQGAGWMGVCAQSFFWTSWRGEVVGCTDLAIQGVVGMITAGLLPRANDYFGTSFVWCCSELFFHLLMISTGLVPSESDVGSTQCWFFLSPRVISALSGINYAVHATNGLLVAADIVPDQSKRARTISMVNNALPMGQLITAITGGMIAQCLGGFEYVFVCYGLFGALVTLVIWMYSSREGFFTRGV